MLANYHTHTTFCDGKNTPEEVVLFAIDRGFDAIGFSGHAYTEFDNRYCINDVDGYIGKINELKAKYNKKIQIYLGMEEDAFAPTDRTKLDYVIGSSHYLLVDGKYYPTDTGREDFKKCMELFNYDIPKLSEIYFSGFCEYVSKNKPDIVGHFDLITKYDEIDNYGIYENEEYQKISKKYIDLMAKNDVLFEVNTGGFARQIKTRLYPDERLLYILKKNNAKLILSSDCHKEYIKNLDFYFEEAKKILRDIGFEYLYVLYDNEFKKDYIK